MIKHLHLMKLTHDFHSSFPQPLPPSHQLLSQSTTLLLFQLLLMPIVALKILFLWPSSLTPLSSSFLVSFIATIFALWLLPFLFALFLVGFTSCPYSPHQDGWCCFSVDFHTLIICFECHCFQEIVASYVQAFEAGWLSAAMDWASCVRVARFSWYVAASSS